MHFSINKILILNVLFWLTIFSEPTLAEYLVSNLGTLGGSSSVPTAMNERSQVVGYSNISSGEQHAFFWEKGHMIDLGTLEGGSTSNAAAINEKGQVVGSSYISGVGTHAFLWEKGQMIDLGTLGGSNSYATAINKRGQVAGVSDTLNGEKHAFLWEKGKIVDLGTWNVSNVSVFVKSIYVSDINDRGQVIGNVQFRCGRACEENHAILWNREKMIDLGHLGGICTPPFCNSGSIVTDINEKGQIVGRSKTTMGLLHAFLWEKGQITDLGTLDGGATSNATAINERGQIIGNSALSGGGTHPFLWEKGQMIDLGRNYYEIASDINMRGQVVGESNGHAFLWEKGQMIDLGTLNGGASARVINDRGQILGVDFFNGNVYAVMWNKIKSED